MRLAAIRPGDIVRIDKRGHRFDALVESVEGDGLRIAPLEHNVTYRTARPREVIGRQRRRPSGEIPAGEQLALMTVSER